MNRVRDAVNIENRYAEVAESGKQSMQCSLIWHGSLQPSCVSLVSHVESVEPLGPTVVQTGADNNLVFATCDGICHVATVWDPPTVVMYPEV